MAEKFERPSNTRHEQHVDLYRMEGDPGVYISRVLIVMLHSDIRDTDHTVTIQLQYLKRDLLASCDKGWAS